MQDSGQWGHVVGGTPRVENTVFLECPLPPRTTCLLRQDPTISEADLRHGLEAKSTGHPNAGQRKGEDSCAGDEDDSAPALQAAFPVLPLYPH